MSGGNVPKLRFPGFVGEWEEKRLAALATIKAGDFVQASMISNTPKEGLYECYGGNGIRGHVAFFNREGRLSLIGRQGALCGNVHFVSGRIYATEHALVAESKSGVNAEWLFYLLSLMNLNRYATGLAQPGISAEVIKGLIARSPTLPEQKKIAAFLGVVDAKIAALRARVLGLQTYKRGLMQALFSQTLRFTKPDGTAFPDWEEKRLGEVAEVNPKSPNLPLTFHYIDLESVNNGVLGDIREIDKVDAPSRAQRLLASGDILYQTVRPYQRNNFLFDLHGVFVASTGYAQLRARQNRTFLFHALHTDEFVNRVMERCTGTSYPAINSSDLAAIALPIPSIDEQAKIADALSTMDAKIMTTAGQLIQMEVFKKGLLQQMFVS